MLYDAYSKDLRCGDGGSFLRFRHSGRRTAGSGLVCFGIELETPSISIILDMPHTS